MTLMMVLVAVMVIGLSAGLAGSSWRTIAQREREAELLWRGDQYRKAIASYYELKHGGAVGQFPTSLDQLLKDPRSLVPLHHIRQLYKDPLTGEDFLLVKQGQKIVGVYSASELEPFKKDRFPEKYRNFAGATSYAMWQFIYTPKAPSKTQKKPSTGAVSPQGAQNGQEAQKTQQPQDGQ